MLRRLVGSVKGNQITWVSSEPVSGGLPSPLVGVKSTFAISGSGADFVPDTGTINLVKPDGSTITGQLFGFKIGGAFMGQVSWSNDPVPRSFGTTTGSAGCQADF